MGEIGWPGELVEVEEGRVKILVPKAHTVKGPGKVGGGPFYNETMAFPRHVTVLFADALEGKAARILDGLSSSGVLGIRIAVETSGAHEITLNDWRKDSHILIQKNLELNGVKDLRSTREDLNLLLTRERFDYVDVDPFGSPARFVDSALRSLRRGGYLSLTATDTAALAGTYPRVCLRRYGAIPARGPIQHELAVRILTGFAVRIGATHDLAVHPLLSLWREHYYKVFLQVVAGARRADHALLNVGKVEFQARGERRIAANGSVGPLWVGPLHDTRLLASLSPRDYMPEVVSRYHELWSEEAEAPPLFYTTDEVARACRISPPGLSRVLDVLVGGGFEAYRTSFDPKGFKTNAGWADVIRLLGGRV